MRLESRAKLDDLVRPAELIESAILMVSRDDFVGNWEKQAAVERQFIIIGESIIRIRDLEPPLFAQIPDARAIIAFRNILVHGYDIADPSAIFDLAQTKLPALRKKVSQIIDMA